MAVAGKNTQPRSQNSLLPVPRVGERTWERGLRRHIGKREDPADEVAREANCEAARGMSL